MDRKQSHGAERSCELAVRLTVPCISFIYSAQTTINQNELQMTLTLHSRCARTRTHTERTNMFVHASCINTLQALNLFLSRVCLLTRIQTMPGMETYHTRYAHKHKPLTYLCHLNTLKQSSLPRGSDKQTRNCALTSVLMHCHNTKILVLKNWFN